MKKNTTRRGGVEINDETMSLSFSDDDDDKNTTDDDESAIIAVVVTTGTTCAVDVHQQQHQPPAALLLLLPPHHGDAASAHAAESSSYAAVATAAAADIVGSDELCNTIQQESSSFLPVFIKSKGPPQIIIMCILLAFGFGSTVGVIPAVMSDRYARLNYNYTDPLDCSAYNNNVTTAKPQACALGSAQAQNAVAVEQFLSNTISFFTSSYIGSLSDQRGRRTILLIGLFLATLTPCCLVLIQVLPNMSANYYYAVSALSSGLVNTLAICLSSLSDVLPQRYRAPSFGLLLAAFSLGFALAPNFAILLGNHLHVSILALVMISCGFLVILLFFPETLSPEAAAQATCMRLVEQEAAAARQQQQQQQQASSSMTTTSRGGWCRPLSRFYNKCNTRRRRNTLLSCPYRPVWELSILNRNRLFRLLSCLAFFNAMASSGDRTLLIYYVQEPDTGISFNDKDIAKMFLIVGLLGIFVQGVVLHHANSWLGERRLVMWCFACGVVHNLFYAVAGQGGSKSFIFTGAALSTLVGMAFPTISAIKSNNVHKCEQGRIQGALYSLQAVASALGPTALRCVHYFTTTKNGGSGGAFSFLVGPGSMFCFASCLYAMAAYCAHLLPPEANSKRDVSNNEIALISDSRGATARRVHDDDEEQQQVPSAATPLL